MAFAESWAGGCRDQGLRATVPDIFIFLLGGSLQERAVLLVLQVPLLKPRDNGTESVAIGVPSYGVVGLKYEVS